MKVTVSGPNLPRPLADKGTMHVHAAGCADLRKYPKGADQGGWPLDADSVQYVVENVYGHQIEEAGATWQDYVSDFYWAPCVFHLPATAPTPVNEGRLEAATESAIENLGEVLECQHALAAAEAGLQNSGLFDLGLAQVHLDEMGELLITPGATKEDPDLADFWRAHHLVMGATESLRCAIEALQRIEERHGW